MIFFNSHDDFYCNATFNFIFVVSSSLVFSIKLIIDNMNGLSQVADSLLFLLSATHPVDAFGEKCLSCVFAQGLPTPFHAFQVEDHCNQ